MKILIVFALFAVAFADEIRVVYPNLPEAPSPGYTRASMGQLIIPNEVIDAWKKDLEAIKVAVPVMRDEAVVADDEGLKVHFVDAPLDFAAPEPVMLGDAPAPAYETESAPEAVKIAEPVFPEAPMAPVVVDAIMIVEPLLPEAPMSADIAVDAPRFVDAPMSADIAVDAPRFVDAPMIDDIAADAPRFVDAPLEAAAPEPIRLPEPVLPAFETLEVSAEPIKIAMPEFHDYRGKEFNDPMLRSAPTVDAIKVVEPQIGDYRPKKFDSPLMR